ncbi:hypothetical protein KEJ32_04075 [Candidatus Bathyarchaeota archaeon]|nr:hypothetical protein [Candidatus Bathyarchaeota archaeon]
MVGENHEKLPHQKTDNKNLTNCLHGDNHIGLCQNPCPYRYKPTSSASDVKCSTFADKPFSSRFRRKRHVKSSISRLSDVLHFNIEAVGVEVHA